MDQRNVLVLGTKGFLGSCLMRDLSGVSGLDLPEFDLRKPLRVDFEKNLIRLGITHAVVTAAISDVEACFTNPVLSRQVNVDGTLAVLSALRNARVFPIFFSSDYVFGSRAGRFTEDAPCEPDTVYGHQKLEVETFIRNQFPGHLIFRTTKLLSLFPHARNPITSILDALKNGETVSLFQDQNFNPFFAEDLSRILPLAVKQGLSGTYHLGMRQTWSRLDLGLFLARLYGFPESKISASRMSENLFSEPRPKNHTLNCTKLEAALQINFTELTHELASTHPL